METYDVGKLLIRIGSILIIIAGIVQLGEWAIYNVMDLLNYGQLYIWPIFGMVSGIVALIIGLLLLLFFYRMIDKNRINAAILILIFGIIGAAFAWDWAIVGGPGAVLILVGAILLFIEAEQGGA
jgi:hypothetical protein